MARYRIGDLITFDYPARRLEGTRAHDKFPLTLVLHPLWNGNVHALNFNYLSDDEINMLRMLVDPSFHLKYIENLNRKNPNLVREFDRIIGQASNAVITSPHNFYVQVVKPFIITRGWDPYRRYNPAKMRSPRIVQPAAVITGEQSRWQFGNPMRDRRGKSEQDIVKDLAKRAAVSEKEQFPGHTVITPAEKRFIERLQGKALNLFRRYKQQFERGASPSMFRRS